MLKAIIFDLDDTLLNDKKSIKKAFSATCHLAAEKYGIRPEQLEGKVRYHARELYKSYSTYEFTQKIGINPFEGLWGTFEDEREEFQSLHHIISDYQFTAWRKGLEELQITDEQLAIELAEAFPTYRKQFPFVYEDTFPILDELKDRYDLIMLTNGAPSLQKTKLNLTPKLKEYFQTIVISGEFGVGKPDPSIFQHVLDLAHVTKEEAIMVGDNLHTDILGSNRLEMENVWINHHGQSVQDIIPTYEITHLMELIPIIKGK